jgi:serpin B
MDMSASGNVAVSSYSIGNAMAMTLHGASGETEREMREALHQTLSREELADTNLLARQLVDPPGAVAPGRTRATATPAFEIKVANGLALGPSDGAVATRYIEDLSAKFGAEVQTNASLDSINNWVRERTGGRIPSILERLHPRFSLVLLNAIAMKARWAEPFNSRNTKQAPFTLANGSRVQVETMHSEAEYAIAQWRGLRAIKIPYADDGVAMIVVVPDQASRFGGRELNLSLRDLDPLLASLGRATARHVELALPRFKLETNVDLKEPFRKLGLSRAFDTRAEFDHMMEAADTSPVIDQIRHRAVVDVDEAGTEASAATAVSMAPGAGTIEPRPRIERFSVDRPFLFMIVDYRNGAMLFTGRVADPRSN